MNYDVVVEPRARRDIHLAAHWILAQSESPATAVRWASKLRATIATLKANPHAARSIRTPTSTAKRSGCCSTASGEACTACSSR